MPLHSENDGNGQDFAELAEDITSYNVSFVKNKDKDEEDDNDMQGGTKGSHHFKLGTLNSLKPFAIYMTLMQTYKYFAIPEDEPVNIPMSRKPFMDNETPVFLMTCFYVFFALYLGPLIMKNRKPIRLKKLMMFYNIFQVCICSYIFLKSGFTSWFYCLGLLKHDPNLRETPCNFYCEPEDRSDSPYNQMVSDVVYLYLLTKLLDWCDTIFFVLQKKWSHISLLHVFHHMGMFYGVWWFSKYVGSGHYTFAGFVNAFVHVVLYLYYFLALLGPKVKKYLWWKKYLTMLQLSQFVIAVFFVPSGMYNNCGLNIHVQINGMIYAFVFLYLFWDFYRVEYNKPPKNSEIEKSLSDKKEPVEMIEESKKTA